MTGYLIVNDYLEGFFKKGRRLRPSDDIYFEQEIVAIASRLGLDLSGLNDYNMGFVKASIFDGMTRTYASANNNVRVADQIRNMLRSLSTQ